MKKGLRSLLVATTLFSPATEIFTLQLESGKPTTYTLTVSDVPEKVIYATTTTPVTVNYSTPWIYRLKLREYTFYR